MDSVLQTAYLLLTPLLCIWLTQKSRLAFFLGPVVFAYLLGMLLPQLPLSLDAQLTNSLRDMAIPLAIPLLLFRLDVVAWLQLARPTVIAFALCLLSLLLSIVTGWAIFRDSLPHTTEVAAMLCGVYSGGTPNMAVVHRSMEAPAELFLTVNSIDLLISGGYFLFLLSLAAPLYRLFLQPFRLPTQTSPGTDRRPALKRALPGLILAMIATSVIVGTSILITLLLTDSLAVALIFCLITAMAIAASFWHPLRQAAYTDELGYFLVLVFCCAIGSQVDLSMLSSELLPLAGMVLTVFAGTVCLHLLACRLCGIDRDTTIITQTAAIFGPPFIPPVANALRNPAMHLSGLTTGLVGYALGSYLGLGLWYLLSGL